MTQLTSYLYKRDYILRSGAAPGADSAFEAGVPENAKKEIYLPWESFQGHDSKLYFVCEKAMSLGERFHPAWGCLSRHGKRLMSRNGYQVLGATLDDPVDFILCWTEGGKMKGGTAQALRIAKYYKIPVFNLGKTKDLEHVKLCVQTEQVFV
jgi:hypothetical protein